MSRRYKGGVISATAPTTSTSAATGVWTLPQQMQAIVGSGWPSQPSGWIGLLSTSSGLQRAGGQFATAVDSSGNVYFGGDTYESVGTFQLLKYNNSGTLQWQKSLSNGGGVYSLVLDSSANIYFTGSSNGSGLSVVKYDTSGSLQWQRAINDNGGSGSNGVSGYGIALDSSSNVYVSGLDADGDTGAATWFIAKYNSSGTLQWQKYYAASSGYSISYGIAIDSSDNIYCCGIVLSSTSNTYGTIIKLNSSGTLQWQRQLDLYGYGLSVNFRAVAVDSSGNIYVSGSATNYNLTACYNSSGTLQWQRAFSTSVGNAFSAQSIAIDSSSNVYVLGLGGSASGYAQYMILKYNSSGSIQWQRSMRITANFNMAGTSISVRGDNLYITGQTNTGGLSPFNTLFAKLPTSGALTGTYSVGGSTVTYAASSGTDSAGIATGSTPTYTITTPALTASTTTYTDSTSTLTSSVTQL